MHQHAANAHLGNYPIAQCGKERPCGRAQNGITDKTKGSACFPFALYPRLAAAKRNGGKPMQKSAEALTKRRFCDTLENVNKFIRRMIQNE
jgi:hypothetical protein